MGSIPTPGMPAAARGPDRAAGEGGRLYQRPMPPIDAPLLSGARILAGYLIFFGSYVVFALGKFPWMKIDRPGAAIIVANLRLGGFFDRVAGAVVGRLRPRHLLPVVVFTTGLLGAFLVNDIVSLVMTPFVLRLTRRLGLKPVPYLLAVALSSNAGSTATITGNPQNMLIGSLSGVSYRRFLLDLAPLAMAGLVMTWAVLRWMGLRTVEPR